MNLSEIIGNSFEYTKRLFSDIGRLVILIILDVIPIVNLVAIGYFARVVRESPSSGDVPKLEGYGEMFVQGLKVAVAGFLYMIVPLILIFSGIAFLGMPWMMRGRYDWGMWAMSPLGIPLIVAGVIVAFFVAIIAAVGIVHMIKFNSLGKAFSFSEILKIIGEIGWGKYVGWLIVMFIIGLIVGGIASVPFIGWLISLIISPVYGVFAARSVALIYCEGAPGARFAPPPPTAAPGPPTTVPAPPSGAILYCKYCGAPASQDAIYCQNCGQRIR